MPGRYCADCGEKRVLPSDLTVPSFIGQLVGDFTNLDGRLLRSLRTLAFRPGALTLDWVRGRRRGYVRPLQLFLLANLVYFVVQPFTGYHGYNTPLRSQMESQFYSEVLGIAEVAEAEAARAGVPLQSYEYSYNVMSEVLAKSLVFVLVPLFGLATALVLWRRRVPLVQHLMFSLHYYSWELLFVDSAFLLVYGQLLRGSNGIPGLLAGGMLEALQASPVGSALVYVLLELPTAPLVLPYLYLAMRRMYGGSRISVAARTLVLAAGQFGCVLCYRLILFRVTILVT